MRRRRGFGVVGVLPSTFGGAALAACRLGRRTVNWLPRSLPSLLASTYLRELRERAHERQPDAKALGRGLPGKQSKRACSRSADTHPGVTHADLDLIISCSGGHPDLATFRSVLGGIVQEVGQELGQSDGVAAQPHRRTWQLHGQRLTAPLKLRLRSLRGGRHHRVNLHGAALKLQGAPLDPREVEEIIGYSPEVSRLPRHHVQGRGMSGLVDPLQDVGGVANGRQWIPKLVADHGQELVFPLIRLLGGLESVPQLPAGRGELGEPPHDPLVFPAKLPLLVWLTIHTVPTGRP